MYACESGRGVNRTGIPKRGTEKDTQGGGGCEGKFRHSGVLGKPSREVLEALNNNRWKKKKKE